MHTTLRKEKTAKIQFNTENFVVFRRWRRHPDSNRGSEFCRLVPYHLAISPYKYDAMLPYTDVVTQAMPSNNLSNLAISPFRYELAKNC